MKYLFVKFGSVFVKDYNMCFKDKFKLVLKVDEFFYDNFFILIINF